MNDESPLIQALKSKMSASNSTVPQDLLDFILTHYDLVPKDDEGQEGQEQEPVDVQTQESHVP